MKKYLFYLVVILFGACEEEVSTLDEAANLTRFIELNADLPVVEDSLIACALSGEAMFLNNSQSPIHILFYPEGNATDFQYFETSNADVDPNDYSQYKMQELPLNPIFNGYLQSFGRAAVSENVWGLVTYQKDGRLHISNPIHIKSPELPTEFDATLLQVNQEQLLEPAFNWQDGRIDENVIYFQVIMDEQGNLISGTYTLDRVFQFYNLSNVVLNISAINPTPVLEANRNYTFVMMAVSIDNWVNLVIEEAFST